MSRRVPDAQRARHIANRAARAVADHRGGERRALAAVFAVDVLDDLLAPFVLEVDIDIRRLIALAADEALEQQLGARRIDLGDAERIADRGVGRRASALTQNMLLARIFDQIMHRQEKVLIAQLGNQTELLLDQFAHRLRDTPRPAALQARLGQGAQMRAGRQAGRHEFGGVLIVQLRQREDTAFGDRNTLIEQRWRIEMAQLRQRAQMPLGIRIQPLAGLIDRAAVAHGSQHILQGAARAQVHVHIAGGDGRQAAALGEAAQLRETSAVIGATMQLHRQPAAMGEKIP